MTDDIPQFDSQRAKQRALPYIKKIVGDHFVRLIIAEDGRCRVIFKQTYFVLQPNKTEPTKSQWSTLKKKFKRHNRDVFVFKQTGVIPCNERDTSDDACYYVDFGFFEN